MTNKDLSHLFNKYLNRDYTPAELKVHGHKKIHILENEILNCTEYLNLIENTFNPNG